MICDCMLQLFTIDDVTASFFFIHAAEYSRKFKKKKKIKQT